MVHATRAATATSRSTHSSFSGPMRHSSAVAHSGPGGSKSSRDSRAQSKASKASVSAPEPSALIACQVNRHVYVQT